MEIEASQTKSRSMMGLHPRKVLCVAAAAALTSSGWTTTHAFSLQGIPGKCGKFAVSNVRCYGSFAPLGRGNSPLFLFSGHQIQPTMRRRLYSSSRMRNRFQSGDNNDDNDPNRKELFGFRRAAKRIARKVLPTKWFGTQKEKEALARKREAKDRVQGELNQMLKSAPLPIQMFGKLVAGPLMGKIASSVAEASHQQAETIENILDEARSYLVNDPSTVDLLGMPIQIGQPHSQSSATTIINGKRQMRMEFMVEISGPKASGISRISATNEGIGQLLVESTGRVYQVDLSSSNRFSASSPSASSSFSSRRSGRQNRNDDDDIIEAEIIDKETSR